MTLYNPHYSRVLEASAGTGKTYTIEQLVANALITPSPLLGRPLELNEILVVTFTKAAASELKDRIRAKLHSKLLEIGEDLDLKRRVRAALAEFDSASIFTIHGFCHKTLQEQAFESRTTFSTSTKESFDREILYEIVEQTLREDLVEEEFEPIQIDLLLSRSNSRPAKLIDSLVKDLSENLLCKETPKNGEIFAQFLQTIPSMREWDFEKEAEALKPFYNKVNDWRMEAFEKASSLIRDCKKEEFFLHAKLILDQLEMLTSDNLPKRKVKILPPFAESLLNEWLPLFRFAAAHSCLYLRLLSLAQKRLKARIENEGPLTFQSLIEKMREAVATLPDFRKRLQEQFRLVMIDEFQDTDPLQWQIFRTLFQTSNHHLILVGDPKQSIYGFRGADIYTYLQASETFTENPKECLRTNYRSSKRLIAALNTLFQSSQEWIPLPLLQSYLPCPPVEAGCERAPLLNHEEPPLEIVEAEKEEYLLPYYAKEVLRLHRDLKVPYHEIAFLVRDKKQAEEIYCYLRSCSIPAEKQKTDALGDTLAMQELIDLLHALEKPKDRARLKRALCGKFFGMDPNALVDIERDPTFLKWIAEFIALRKKCLDIGVAQVLYDITEKSTAQILSQENGDEFVEHLQAILEWSISIGARAPEELLKHVYAIDLADDAHAATMKKKGVQLITMHYSKGLEYLCVFAVGLGKRTKTDRNFSKVRTEEGQVAMALFKGDPLYEGHLKELDAEKARLLYVALTRAKEKLYIPFHPFKKNTDSGKASAWELFSGSMQEIERSELIAFKTISDPSETEIAALEEEPVLIPPPHLTFHFQERYQFSFTSLAKQTGSFEKKTLQGEGLPRGQETGILLHELFEKLPWSLVKDAKQAADLYPFLDKQLPLGKYFEWMEQIAEMLYSAISKPLAEAGCCIKDLKEEQIYREIEFSYRSEKGVCRGVIDFCFQHQGKFFIIDWKSNLLSGYTQEYLIEEMNRHDYFLQSTLYRNALEKYLEVVHSQKLQYGGAFYVFVRGLPNNEGVLWIAP